MRVKIVKYSDKSVDGTPLRKFIVGFTYDVGTALGNYLLADGLAVPVVDQAPALVVPIDGKAQVMTDYLETVLRRASSNADDRPRRRRRTR